MIDFADDWPSTQRLDAEARSFLRGLPDWMPRLPPDPAGDELIDLVEFAASRLELAGSSNPDGNAAEATARHGRRLGRDLRRRRDLAAVPGQIDQALAFATTELLRRGFERAMAFHCEGGNLEIVSTTFITKEDWAAENHENAAANPVPLVTDLFESLVIDRQVPALIEHPLEDPRAWTPIVGRMQCADYVVAPIVHEGRTVGTIHADCFFSRTGMDVGHRDEIGSLAAEISHRLGVRDPAPAHDLSEREHQVYDGLRRGLTNRAIADELHVGTETVKTYVARLLRKLDVPNRSAAVGLGLTPPTPTTSPTMNADRP